MKPFRHFLPELVLVVAEHAAWDEVHSTPGWVATLRLVSPPFRAVVTPILFHTIVVGPGTLARLLELSTCQDTPLVHTRAIVFSLCVATSDDQVEACEVDPRFAPLARALPNLRAFTGKYQHLEALAHFNPHLRLSSAYVTNNTSDWGAVRCFAAALSAVPRVHVFLDMFGQDRMFALHAQYILFDIEEDLDAEALAVFLPGLDAALRRASLLRLTLRLRATSAQSRLIAERLTAYALRMREPRLWLEDEYVPIEGTDSSVYDSIDRDDALQGDALWLIGRQLYHPMHATGGGGGERD